MNSTAKTKFSNMVFAAGLTVIAGTGVTFAEECKNPAALRFSMIPTEETTQELDLYKPLVETLKEATGKPVEFYLPTSYASVVEAMLNGWVDIGMHGPNSYVIAREKDPTLEVFATYAKHKGHFQEEGPGYKAVLVTRSDSGLDDVAAIKGSVVGPTDPASTSGNLLPRVGFVKEIEMPLEEYFSRVVYTGGHDLSAMAVFEKKVDAAFVATHRLDNVIDRELATMDDYKVLWASPVIPQDPFVYSSNLCDDIKEQIRGAFLTLHESDAGREYLKNVNASKFVPMTDADYDIIRELRAAKKANE